MKFNESDYLSHLLGIVFVEYDLQAFPQRISKLSNWSISNIFVEAFDKTVSGHDIILEVRTILMQIREMITIYGKLEHFWLSLFLWGLAGHGAFWGPLTQRNYRWGIVPRKDDESMPIIKRKMEPILKKIYFSTPWRVFLTFLNFKNTYLFDSFICIKAHNEPTIWTKWSQIQRYFCSMESWCGHHFGIIFKINQFFRVTHSSIY